MAEPKQDFATLSTPGAEAKIRSIFDFTAESLEELASWLEQRGLRTPVSQILGFQQFTPQVAAVVTAETTTSATYTNLATTGPTLSGLPDGKYAIQVTAAASIGNVATDAWMSYSVNADSATDARGSRVGTLNQISGLAMWSTVTLAGGGNNSIVAKYRSADGVNISTFTNRCLLAIRYANA